MTYDIGALLALWARPYAVASEAAAAFRELYTDPVSVNGVLLTADQLVRSARLLQQAFDDLHREVIDVCDAGSTVAVAFRLEGRHVGPLTTSAGVLPPTGQFISVRVIDVLRVLDGRISPVTTVADELGALTAGRAAALVV